MSSEDISISGNTFSLEGATSIASTFSLGEISLSGSKCSLHDTPSEIVRNESEEPNSMGDYVEAKEDNKSYTLDNVDDSDFKEMGDFLNPPDKQSNYGDQELEERMSHRLDQLARYENSQADNSEMGDGNVNGNQGVEPILTWKKFLEKVKENQTIIDSLESDK